MAWSNASIVHSYKCCEHMSRKRLTGNALSRLSCMLVALQYIPLQAFPPLSSCLGFYHRNLSIRKLPMTLARIMANYCANWLNFETSWKQTSLRRHTIRRSPMTTMSRRGPSKWGIQYGCPYPQQENWILDGKESG